MNFSIFGHGIIRRLAARRWICTRCRGRLPGGAPQSSQPFSRVRQYSSSYTSSQSAGSSPKRKRVILWAASGAATGATVLAFTDDIKHGYESAERTSRVAAALFVCINEYIQLDRDSLYRQLELTVSSYRTTLNQREKISDEEEQTRLLKDCHKRCAVRTLKVLEKNGGIFIKLGQHLVGRTSLALVTTRTTTNKTPERDELSSASRVDHDFRPTARQVPGVFHGVDRTNV